MTDINLDAIPLSNAVPDALILRVERPLVGRRRDVTVDVPGRAGSLTYVEEPGDRVISIDVDIQSAGFDERRAAVRNLAKWADTGAVVPMIVDDEPDRFHEVILDDDPDPNEWLVRGEATLKMRAGPYALANVPDVETVGIGSGVFDAESERFAYPVIEITPNGGDINSFAIDLNGDTLTWFGTTKILDGDTVTVSSLSDTMTRGENVDTMLTGAYDPDFVDMADVRGAFGLIVPGENSWAFSRTGTATTVEVKITWRARYL